MNRGDFQQLAELRLEDARVLFAAGRYAAAYYLCGYAVECGLKACIARQFREHEYPPRNAQSLYTHDIDRLVLAARLEEDLSLQKRSVAGFSANWSIVRAWSEESRYALASREQAEEIIAAVTEETVDALERSPGVMTWIRRHW